jgi:hypothetical protein
MFKIILTSFLILVFIFCTNAQKKVQINESVYNQGSVQVKLVIKYWSMFLNDSISLSESINKFALPSLFSVKKYQNTSFIISNKPTILSIIPENDSIFSVKTIFSITDNLGFSHPTSIVTVPIKLINKKCEIYEPFLFNIQYWQKKTIDSINFIAKPNFPFKQNQIDSTFAFNKKLSDLFNIPPLPFTYIVFDDKADMWRQMGYDFQSTMHNSAMSISRYFIFSSTNNLYHPHEMVHLYINAKTNDSKNFWFNEGVASFLGGHRGLPLVIYYPKMLEFLNKNPTIKLSNLLAYKNVDDWADFRYIIGGLFCQIIYENEGMKGIYKLLNTPNDEVEFYNTIKKYFGVNQAELHEYILTKLNSYSNK